LPEEPPPGLPAEPPQTAPDSRPGPASDDFDPKQHIWDGRNWWTADRQQWWDGTRWQGKDSPLTTMAMPEPPPAHKVRRPGYWRDFWLGFVGVIVGNILLAIILNVIANANLGDAVTAPIVAAPWVINIGAIILLAIVRPPAALGMLLAYGIAFGLALLVGIFLAVLCFGGGGVP